MQYYGPWPWPWPWPRPRRWRWRASPTGTGTGTGADVGIGSLRISTTYSDAAPSLPSISLLGTHNNVLVLTTSSVEWEWQGNGNDNQQWQWCTMLFQVCWFGAVHPRQLLLLLLGVAVITADDNHLSRACRHALKW